MGFNLTPMVRNLLLLNVVIFILQKSDITFMAYLPLRPIQSDYFMPHQLLTYMFLHDTSGWRHILSNMIGLLIFGPLLEQFWGSQRFLFFYLFTGVGAGVLHLGVTYFEVNQIWEATELYLQDPTPQKFVSYISKYASELYTNNFEFVNNFQDNPTNSQYIKETKDFVRQYYSQRSNIPTVGASGAVFGILMAFGLLFPNTEILLYFLFPVKAKYIVALYGIYEVFAGFQQAPGDSVAHFAHIGGMLFAYILVKHWGNQRNRFY
jgi:membrane associated rhomboid family serine protease